jgi:hypothetical protein
MVRSVWLNLNGRWEYELPADLTAPPFGKAGRAISFRPIESALSGDEENGNLYPRTSTICHPETKRTTHFGAVDWEATGVCEWKTVNQGGYDPFSFDITTHCSRRTSSYRVLTSDGGDQPWKQVRHQGIWYTPAPLRRTCGANRWRLPISRPDRSRCRSEEVRRDERAEEATQTCLVAVGWKEES